MAPLKTHIKQNKTKNKQTSLTTGYTLCVVNTEDTIRHNIALATSTRRFYIPYLLGSIIKLYENLTQVTKPYVLPQSVTYEKENTKQSKSITLLMYLKD